VSFNSWRSSFCAAVLKLKEPEINFFITHGYQGRSIHDNGVSPANISKRQIKSLLSYFYDSLVLPSLEHSRTDQIKLSLASSSQPDIVSQIVEAYARDELLVDLNWLTMHFV
jgi:hypothetical protein